MVEYTFVHREPEAFQQPISFDEIKVMCERAFGQRTAILSITELGDGQFNNTYLIRLLDQGSVILRVAPSITHCIFWHEEFLMRRELSIQPFLAPIAPLLPRTLVTDFTHQLIDRDYMFQSYMPGETWLTFRENLTPEEHDDLWRQFGRLVKTISSVQGDTFGLVHHGPQFSRWSPVVIDWLQRTIIDAKNTNMDAILLHTLLSIVCRNTSLLDEITHPRLLHGDLWLFNLLFERKEDGPRITAVLDADRGSWGDPLADWTFFLLSRRGSLHEQALFWQEYGKPEQDVGARFRQQVYEGLHQGKILSVAARDRNARVVSKAHDALGKVVTVLQRTLAGDALLA